MPGHANLTDAADLHIPGVVSTSDPGAVGAYKIWIDTGVTGSPSNPVLKVRNGTDAAWVNIAITDPELAALAGLASAADKGIMFTGSGTAATFTLTAAALTVLDDTTVGAMLTTLGVTAAAQTVLDDTTVAAMVDTLGGASSTGTGGLVRASGPTLTNPIVGTQSASDNSTKAASTAYVDTADALKANLASPTFTGTPAAPTATAGTNTTQLATTAFVSTAVGSGTPGTGSLPYMYPFGQAIADPINDNFRGGSLDTTGARFSGASAWTWLNQGGATATLDGANLWLTSPSSASLSLRGIYQSVPSGSWCIRAAVQFRNGSAAQAVAGMFLRDSGSSKIEFHGIGFTGGSAVMWQAKMTDATTFSASRAFPATAAWPTAGAHLYPAFLEIEYDGTSYYYRASTHDGAGLLVLAKFAKTDFLTSAADQIGLFSMNDSSVATTLISAGFYRVPASNILTA